MCTGLVLLKDSRAAFVQELRRILGPVMKNGPKEALQKRLQKCRQRREDRGCEGCKDCEKTQESPVIDEASKRQN